MEVRKLSTVGWDQQPRWCDECHREGIQAKIFMRLAKNGEWIGGLCALHYCRRERQRGLRQPCPQCSDGVLMGCITPIPSMFIGAPNVDDYWNCPLCGYKKSDTSHEEWLKERGIKITAL